jgi:hypothetical protein
MYLPCAAAALVLLAALPARASGPPSAMPPPPGYTIAPTPGATRRDPAIALGLSLGVTAAGLGLLAAAPPADESDLGDGMALAGLLAILIGPTTGHLYADRIGNTGLGIRAVSASVGLVAFSGLGLCAFDLSGDDDDDGEHCGWWAMAAVGSSLLYAGGTIYEIVDAPRAARAYNQRHGLDLALAPTAVRAGDGSQAPGLAVSGSF